MFCSGVRATGMSGVRAAIERIWLINDSQGQILAHIRQSRSDSRPDFKVLVPNPFRVVPASLGRGMGHTSDSLFPGDPEGCSSQLKNNYFAEKCVSGTRS